MIYYTSDLHLYHKNIIRLCERPYSTIELMNEDIIYRWNKKVKPEDTVYILGDMFFRSESIEQIKNTLKQMNGHKILINGNHDSFTQQLNYKEYFDKVCDYLKVKDGDREVVLFHYPIEEWDGFYRGSYHLYGHVHNSKNAPRLMDKRYNVGVDVNNFEPKTLDELIAMKK